MMTRQETDMIPSTLPILPLAEYILLPSIVTNLMLCKSEADTILQNSTDYIICIPLATSNNRKGAGTNNTHHAAASTTDLSQLFHYGCVAKVIECDRSLPNICTLKVEGICRSRIRDISSMDGGGKYEALLEHYPELKKGQEEEEEEGRLVLLVHTLIEKMRLIGISSSVLNGLSELMDHCPISYVANLLMYITDAPFGDKLRVLELEDGKEKLKQVNHAVNRYLQVNNKGFFFLYLLHINWNFYLCITNKSVVCVCVKKKRWGGEKKEEEAKQFIFC